VLLLRQANGRVLRLAGEITARGAIGDVVALVAQAGWAGELVVLSVDADAGTARWRSRSLFFESGNILGAQTTVPSERIGPLLQRLGHLDQRQLDTIEASLQSAPGGRRFGEVAVQLGVVSRERLFEVIGLQIKEIAFAMFLVERGTLYFLEGFDPDRVATQHRLGRARVLHLEIVFTNQIADMFQHLVDRMIRSGDGAVDTFVGEEQRALDAMRAAHPRQGATNFHAIVDGIELVECDDADGEFTLHRAGQSVEGTYKNRVKCVRGRQTSQVGDWWTGHLKRAGNAVSQVVPSPGCIVSAGPLPDRS
jgi:hypothetical protein